jgi:hypothetical protein
MELKRWLDANGQGKFAKLFEENGINMRFLIMLVEDDLRMLPVTGSRV